MAITVDVEMTAKTNDVNKALGKLFAKYPQLIRWQETFKDMASSNTDFLCDCRNADGTKRNWSYALQLVTTANYVYMSIIEREVLQYE